jgi:hypothetical protein
MASFACYRLLIKLFPNRLPLLVRLGNSGLKVSNIILGECR